MHRNISDFVVGERVSGIYIVRAHALKKTRTDKDYVTLTVFDKTGEISGNRFNVEEQDIAIFKDIEDGGVVSLVFSVKEYEGKKQMNIEAMAAIKDIYSIDLSEIIPSSPIPPQTLFDEITETVASFRNEELKAVVTKILADNEEKIKQIPAAKSVHHAFLGGLALHTGGMLRLAKNISTVFEGRINKELLFAGVIIHDIKKIDEFKISPIGMVQDYSTRGKLLGHIVMGAEYIGKICDELHVSDEVKLCLQHMILSHHGQPDYGSPVYPAFIEASLLNAIDLMDSRMVMFEDATRDIPDHTFSERKYTLNNVQVYKHNLTPPTPEVEPEDGMMDFIDLDLTF